MIEYCCGYCRKLNTDECKGGCYNALGGEEHLKWAIANICKINDGSCVEEFPFSKKKLSECWEKNDPRI